MNAIFAFLDDIKDFIDSNLCPIINFQSATCYKPAIVYCKYNSVKKRGITSVKWTVYEHALGINWHLRYFFRCNSGALL